MARSILAALGLICLALASNSQASDTANTKPPVSAKSNGVKPTSTKPAPKAPTWQQLTPQQKQLLAELASQWDRQPDRLRINLVKVANKYPKMKPDEQARVRKRITRWASLTPEQRETARKHYQLLKKQPPEKQKEVQKKWEAYKAQQRAEPPAAIAPTPGEVLPSQETAPEDESP